MCVNQLLPPKQQETQLKKELNIKKYHFLFFLLEGFIGHDAALAIQTQRKTGERRAQTAHWRKQLCRSNYD